MLEALVEGRRDVATLAERKLGRPLRPEEARAIDGLSSLMLIEAWCRMLEAPVTGREQVERELAALVAGGG